MAGVGCFASWFGLLPAGEKRCAGSLQPNWNHRIRGIYWKAFFWNSQGSVCTAAEGRTSPAGWNWCAFHCWKLAQSWVLWAPWGSCGSPEGCCWGGGRSEAGTLLNPMEISFLSGTLLATFLCKIHYCHYLVGKLCPTLCDPMDCNPPVCGISQARTVEWIAISFSRGSLWLRDRTCISYMNAEETGSEGRLEFGFLFLVEVFLWFCFSITEMQCVRAKLFQLCLTLCDPMDCNPPGSSVH